jgi:hypothetical protein
MFKPNTGNKLNKKKLGKIGLKFHKEPNEKQTKLSITESTEQKI